MISRLISTVAVCAVIGGISGAVVAGTNARPSPAYDMSLPADRALAAFEHENPKCAMWTNWQKLCSRTGNGGSTYCRTDPLHRTTPSAPFCEKGEEIVDTPVQENSRLRYCGGEVKDFEFHNETRNLKFKACEKYVQDRPFGGSRITQMVHPACETWGNGEPRGDICTMHPNRHSKLPYCLSPVVRAKQRKAPWVCTAWRSPKPCRLPIGGRKAVDRTIDGAYVYDLVDLNRGAVWGTYCPIE